MQKRKAAKEKLMSYQHAFYAPYRVGDRVEVVEGAEYGKQGVVTRVESQDVFFAQQGKYFVTFAGKQQERFQPFTFFELAFASQQEV